MRHTPVPRYACSPESATSTAWPVVLDAIADVGTGPAT
jgi:hypothetical protein